MLQIIETGKKDYAQRLQQELARREAALVAEDAEVDQNLAKQKKIRKSLGLPDDQLP